MPILTSCKKIQGEIIRALDPELFRHLDKLGLEPQLYGIRWLRLLFSREYEIDELLILWDGIFSHDSNLSLVEWVASAMLIVLRKDCNLLLLLHKSDLRLTWLLVLEEDYTGCLVKLMRFPSLSSVGTTITEVLMSAQGLQRAFESRSSDMSPQPSLTSQPVLKAPSKKRDVQPWMSIGGPVAVKMSDAAPNESQYLKEHILTLEGRLSRYKSRDMGIAKTLEAAIRDLEEVLRGENNPTDNKYGLIKSVVANVSSVIKGLQTSVSDDDDADDVPDAPKEPSTEPIERTVSASPQVFHTLKRMDGLGIRNAGVTPPSNSSRSKSPAGIELEMSSKFQTTKDKMVDSINSSVDGIRAFTGFLNESAERAFKTPSVATASVVATQPRPGVPDIYKLTTSSYSDPTHPRNPATASSKPVKLKQEEAFDPLGAVRGP